MNDQTPEDHVHVGKWCHACVHEGIARMNDPEARLAAALPCTKKDWPEDSCDHWVEKYDQEPCDNCALRRTIAADLALAAAGRNLYDALSLLLDARHPSGDAESCDESACRFAVKRLAEYRAIEKALRDV